MIDEFLAVEPHAPLFFVSYARNLPSSDLILKFFEDLSNHVRELVGREVGADPGFLDRSMQGGTQWALELLGAVGRCQVFIPLISASLFKSDWCGYEWDAFSRRVVLNRHTRTPDSETAILPVMWSPVKPDREPPVVGRIQRFTPSDLPDPKAAAMYEKEGIYGLRNLGLDVAYQAVVWRLGQRVAEILHSHFVRPETFSDVEQLRNVFAEEGG